MFQNTVTGEMTLPTTLVRRAIGCTNWPRGTVRLQETTSQTFAAMPSISTSTPARGNLLTTKSVAGGL